MDRVFGNIEKRSSEQTLKKQYSVKKKDKNELGLLLKRKKQGSESRPVKILIESLILAQDERWRRA